MLDKTVLENAVKRCGKNVRLEHYLNYYPKKKKCDPCGA